MKKTNSPFLRVKILLILLSTLFIQACANVVSPTGGPKDETPPILVSELPINNMLHFDSKKITIEFDEIIQLRNASKEINISPEQELSPEYVAKKNRIEIKFMDTLKTNTTYSINFGKAIADVTESNPYSDYKYVFSTGNYIDSLSIYGKVYYDTDTSLTKEVIVALYDTVKADIYTKKPILYTTTQTGGSYRLDNIKPGTYSLYAIKDFNSNKRYDEGELFGFLDSTVLIKADSSRINLNIAPQVPKALKVKNQKYADGNLIVKLNYPSDSLGYSVFYPDDFKKAVHLENMRDSLSFWLPTVAFDSTQIQLTNNKVPFDTILVRNFNKTPKPIQLKIVDNTPDNVLKPNERFSLMFPKPLLNPDLNEIEILQDSSKTVQPKITLNTLNPREYFVDYEWDSNHFYFINVKTEAFTDIYSNKTVEYHKKFRQDSAANYGTILMNVKVGDGKQYIIELINQRNIVLKKVIANESKTYALTLIPAGSYRIRRIEDRNKNSKWDIGDFQKAEQPEKVSYSKDPTQVRANWEVEVKMTLR